MTENLNKIEHQDGIKNINGIHHANAKEGIGQVLENKEKFEKYKKDLLQSIILSFFNYDGSLGRYCGKGRQECTDGSDLYILTKEGLIKVGCGEFNSDTFINGVYSQYDKKYNQRYNFKGCPIPLYVVNQSDSYFARGKTQILMKEDPQKYLEKYTVLYKPNDNTGEVFSKFDEENNNKGIKIDKNNIIEISDAILLFRNKIISKYDKNLIKKYMRYLQCLTIKELKEYAKKTNSITNEEEKGLWFTLYNDMGCERSGCAIYDNNAIKARYDLIQSFDIDKLQFTSVPELNTKNIKTLKNRFDKKN